MREPPTNPGVCHGKNELTHLRLEQVVPSESNLAYAAASELWTTARLRAEVKRVKEPPAPRSSKKPIPAKPAFSVTADNAFIDFNRLAELTNEQREQLADELVASLRARGYAVVIHPPAR